MLRRASLLSIDALLVAAATVLAILLRDSFDPGQEKMVSLIPFVGISIAVFTIAFFLGGLDRNLWRYSSLADYRQIIVLSILAVLATFVLTFAVNRLEGIARSLPVLQAVLVITMLISARVAARHWLQGRVRQTTQVQARSRPRETVLVAGVNAVSELFLQSVREIAFDQIDVAGILAEDAVLRGRTVQQRPILGTIDDLDKVLGSLRVHGVAVDRIVVATAADRLSPHALHTLLEVEKNSDIALQFLSERLGFDDSPRQSSAFSECERAINYGQQALALKRTPDHLNVASNPFWIHKRIVDFLAAAMLVIVFAPVIALVGLLVALDVGFPVIFWQKRPGLHGRPFRILKFRTMHAPYDSLSRRLSDEQRLSAVGRFLRRTRLDELPQLYNILVGHMSFVGPRPLLPCDQSPEFAARLGVRPGITGWAQINGGRIVTARDKAILDIWYISNASFMLDLRIVLRTVHMILFGDRCNIDAIAEARIHLEQLAGLRLMPSEIAIPAE